MLRRSLAAMLVARRCVSLAAKHRVVVVGGTHGNEYTGVWLEKALQTRPTRSSAIQLRWSEPAVPGRGPESMHYDQNSTPPTTVEAKREEVDAALGQGSPDAADLVIDLHHNSKHGRVMICDA